MIHTDALYIQLDVGDHVFYMGQVYVVVKETKNNLKLDRVVWKRKTKPIYANPQICVKIDSAQVENYKILWALKNV